MTGIYHDKTAGHWRVRITANGKKQRNIGTTQDETVAGAMYDLFVRLNGLVDSIPLNYRKMNMLELYRLIEDRDPRALDQVMKKSKLKLVRNDNPELMRSES